MFSPDTYRKVARAALANAQSLYEESKLLYESGRLARSAVLAVIGVEEHAKTAAYTLAAIFPDQADVLKKSLVDHNVKQVIANSFEGAQIVANESPLICYQETGTWPLPEEQLLGLFVQLARIGLKEIAPLPKAAKKYNQKAQEECEGFLTTPYIKNAGLYVDISANEEILEPTRVEKHAKSELLGLEWCIEQSEPLEHILSDDNAWKQFSDSVRSKVTLA